MAKDKERSINPAQQARKQEKNRAIKKSKNEQQARRNEKLAGRNPERIQRQIDDLKALESSGEIKPREKAILADLERDLRAVKKAREALGDKAPTFSNARPRNDHKDDAGRRDGVLGKRGRDGERRSNTNFNNHDSDSGGETDDSVRNIPMPRDTPPPIPREFRHNNQQRYHQQNIDAADQDTANPTRKEAVEAKTTYSSAPQLRDLRKEATSRFVPTVVKRKQEAIQGVRGELLEPEEMDRLEAAGYYGSAARDGGTSKGKTDVVKPVLDDERARRLAEEEARFEQELAAAGEMDVDVESKHQSTIPSRPTEVHQVEIEEVEDEDL